MEDKKALKKIIIEYLSRDDVEIRDMSHDRGVEYADKGDGMPVPEHTGFSEMVISIFQAPPKPEKITLSLSEDELATLSASLHWCVSAHDMAKQRGRILRPQDEQAVEGMRELLEQIDEEHF